MRDEATFVVSTLVVAKQKNRARKGKKRSFSSYVAAAANHAASRIQVGD